MKELEKLIAEYINFINNFVDDQIELKYNYIILQHNASKLDDNDKEIFEIFKIFFNMIK